MALKTFLSLYIYPPSHVLMCSGTHVPVMGPEPPSDGNARGATKMSKVRFFKKIQFFSILIPEFQNLQEIMLTNPAGYNNE